MKKFAHLAVLAGACVLAAGCWQTKIHVYRGAVTLTPFQAGSVTETDPGSHVRHYALTRIAHNRYRLAGSDKGQDFGEGFDLAFFALPGAPANVLVYEAAALDHPVDDAALRYYGLVVLNKTGAAEIRPDCGKDAGAAKASNTVASKDDACTFKDRAALETSLLALWKSGRQPQYDYRLK
jgi:hypothetical protein